MRPSLLQAFCRGMTLYVAIFAGVHMAAPGNQFVAAIITGIAVGINANLTPDL